MRRLGVLTALLLLSAGSMSHATGPTDVEEKLRTWQKGVWLNPGGTYTVWTDTHYFVVQGQRDGDSANVYCGASQVAFTDKGIARKQLVRVRKSPNQSWYISTTPEDFDTLGMERPLAFDESKFKPGTCIIEKGIIYDAVDEVTPDYILLSTCGGDRIKLYREGIMEYLPSGGGAFRSIKIEKW
ncbi:MAG: hypothetical protein AB1792_01900 [Candidatus Zixiibacteriota bacterium]